MVFGTDTISWQLERRLLRKYLQIYTPYPTPPYPTMLPICRIPLIDTIPRKKITEYIFLIKYRYRKDPWIFAVWSFVWQVDFLPFEISSYRKNSREIPTNPTIPPTHPPLLIRLYFSSNIIFVNAYLCIYSSKFHTPQTGSSMPHASGAPAPRGIDDRLQGGKRRLA